MGNLITAWESTAFARREICVSRGRRLSLLVGLIIIGIIVGFLYMIRDNQPLWWPLIWLIYGAIALVRFALQTRGLDKVQVKDLAGDFLKELPEIALVVALLFITPASNLNLQVDDIGPALVALAAGLLGIIKKPQP